MNLEVRARWRRYWHCLFRLHAAETFWSVWPWNVTRVACHTCGKVFDKNVRVHDSECAFWEGKPCDCPIRRFVDE